jgi:hypothetical protein
MSVAMVSQGDGEAIAQLFNRLFKFLTVYPLIMLQGVWACWMGMSGRIS